MGGMRLEAVLMLCCTDSWSYAVCDVCPIWLATVLPAGHFLVLIVTMIMIPIEATAVCTCLRKMAKFYLRLIDHFKVCSDVKVTSCEFEWDVLAAAFFERLQRLRASYALESFLWKIHGRCVLATVFGNHIMGKESAEPGKVGFFLKQASALQM